MSIILSDGNVGEVFEKLIVNGIEKALRECQSADYKALFIPELAEERVAADSRAYIWQNRFDTPSVRAAGRGNSTNFSRKGGTPLVVYAHVENYFSNPDNIKNSYGNLRNGAGVMPQEEFQRLLDLEDNKRVFVIDYDVLRNSPSGKISLRDALLHPQTIPFLGGKERAEKYLAKFQLIYGKNTNRKQQNFSNFFYRIFFDSYILSYAENVARV